MSVLFLDLDGVLVTSSSRRAGGRNTSMDPAKVAMLDELVVEVGASIVVSSTWRSSHDMPGILLAQWPGIPLHQDWRTGHWADIAPDATNAFRGIEIADWLARHPEVSTYVVLDDETGFLPDQVANVVMTETDRGLEHQHIALLRHRLGGSSLTILR
ncbi:HAD domain-containing protein [Bosea sp. RAC05]|uniref:HAD domain-containing protein n=1 Tax=Bosea sp. RAC05 TaxID=1842539 RepID=UPI00083DB4F5|nr:HAD domain-containing protein [Bosea sp. RAC05]AOG03238.1 hypothetical protein BSY19_4889 [Bosea sp. RAC05]